MAHEKLIIKNFIGIKDLELEINRFNVFIGPQASGKSVIVKLIHFFRSVFQEMQKELLISNDSIEDFTEKLKGKFSSYFPNRFLSDKEFTIDYVFHSNNRITLYGGCSETWFKFSEGIIDFYKEASNRREEMKDFSKKNLSINIKILGSMRFRRFLRNSPLWQEEPIFIPAGRAFFSIFQENIFRFLSLNPGFDPFFENFGRIYESFRSENELLDLKKDAIIATLIKNLLHGKYEFKNGKGYLKLDDREVDLEHSSSGQQEVLPLMLTLLWAREYNYKCTLIIEEPEAHLFPATQKNITELIAAVFNSKENREDIFITTHSPYILTALNTLLYAGQIAKKLEDKTKLNRIVPPVLQMNFKDVSVWALDSKGKCKSVMNKKTGLIDAVIIDDVSNKIFEEFDKLVNLDE